MGRQSVIPHQGLNRYEEVSSVDPLAVIVVPIGARRTSH